MTEFRTPDIPENYLPDDLTVPQFILDHRHPTRPVHTNISPWLIEEVSGKGVSYEELRTRTFGLANALKLKWNIGEDDVVCLFSPNHIDYPTAIWAVHRLGGIITPSNPSYTAEELVYQIETTKANWLVVHSDNLPTALKAARDTGIPLSNIILMDNVIANGPYLTVDRLVEEGLSEPAAFMERKLVPSEARTKLAFLCFSSGTTGRPKAVAISHFSVITNIIQISLHSKVYMPTEQRRYRPGDVIYGVVPLYHIYGVIVNLHWALYSGLPLVVAPKFNFHRMLKSIQHYHINHLLLVPPMMVLLGKSPEVKKYDLSSLRSIMCGAAPLSAELTLRVAENFPHVELGQGYGMTETTAIVAFPRGDQKIGTLGSAGQMVPGVTVRVVKEDGSFAKIGEEGELYIKSPSLALGYFNNEEATKNTFVDGWVRTGDQVTINEEAMIFVVDRLKEIMKVKGFQVAPAELEGHLLNHPDVTDTCVVGIPDEYSGEVPLAFVVLSPDAQARLKRNPSAEGDRIKASIINYVADHKVHYKRLAGGVEFVDWIPKNPSGKLLRRLLRKKASELIQARNAAKAKL